ncbi:DNA-binding protein [Sulfurimonas sp.]|uniref:DNA-binding protein n=1 Tax=Sulfurimonas sp. TaxID=2022749 RepID=UPI001A024769|nr:DNA-binding protein [Sulfurimonas sp.]MBE0514948.1 DNA-binding protein [Sulfurimonas sp.]
MTKLSISDAADKLGVSKEAIHNRIRRGSLQSVVEDGVKLVILSPNKSAQAKAANISGRKAASHTDERYYKLLEEQNAKLQQKVESLESETRSLRDQKEQMLIEEREKIEQIYKEKDEQLKNIINAISSKFILNTPPEEPLEVEIEHIQKEDSAQEKRLVALNKYLKSKDFSKKKRKEIKEAFKIRAQDDPRVIEIDKKYYIDLQKYDYSDFSL